MEKDELTRKYKWDRGTEIPNIKVLEQNFALNDISEVEEASNAYPEGKEDPITAPVLRKHSFCRTNISSSVRRS